MQSPGGVKCSCTLNYLLVYIEFAWEASWRLSLSLFPQSVSVSHGHFCTFYTSVLSQHSRSTLKKKHVYLRFWESSPGARKRKGRAFMERNEGALNPLDSSKNGKCIVQTKLFLADIDHHSWHNFSVLYLYHSKFP